MPVLKKRESEAFYQAVDATPLVKSQIPKGYYVYLLVDPRTDEIFYVGKGKGNRHAAHERYFWSKNTRNPSKNLVISSILSDGYSVGAYCYQDGLTEAEALDLEHILIFGFGRDRLTNFSFGNMSERSRNKILARFYLSQAIPFDIWVRICPRSREEIALYHRITTEFEKIAREGWESTIFIPYAKDSEEEAAA